MASSIASDANTEYLNLKRKSSDIGWNYGALINSNNLDKVKCHLCGHKFSGGVYRLQQHIVGIKGNVKPCFVAKENDKKKCKAAIEERNKKKENKETQKKLDITFKKMMRKKMSVLLQLVQRDNVSSALWINMHSRLILIQLLNQ